ncbi:hypothetical protein PUN28_013584 [Cardiocondyla obscurior]|uniref:Uncharacterized protein n=1 Tax=Cardiocondyla obscurior TaxID=286306 RepID=A0AAW2F5R1_9HYME
MYKRCEVKLHFTSIFGIASQTRLPSARTQDCTYYQSAGLCVRALAVPGASACTCVCICTRGATTAAAATAAAVVVVAVAAAGKNA